MAAAAAANLVRLKLLIDKKSQRVLFAEADKEFVDFLFGIFTLPVGTVTRLLKEGGGGSGMVGCLPSLYRSIENLNFNYMEPDMDKRFLLEPKVIMPGVKIPLLLPNVESTFRPMYSCPTNCGSRSAYVADDYGTICPKCQSKIDRLVTFMDPPRAISASYACEEGYVKGTVKYMVMDDLEVKALSTASLVTLLTQFRVNVNEIGAIEEKLVDFGMAEGVKLLGASLQSNTVLTDIFLPAEMDAK